MTGDSQQFKQDQAFMRSTDEGGGGVVPTVNLIWMTPDPLGAVAALASMYEGRVVRSLSEVTDDDRRKAFANVQKTHLRAPLEAVKLHFLIEGVDRAFTHQLVRQRTAVYAQESLRFAVVDDLMSATTLPPSLSGTWTTKTEEGFQRLNDEGPLALGDKSQRWRMTWDDAIETVDRAYRLLVDSGMPAEEARGLLPHCTATRIQYVTDLRNLAEHAGNRLCTQAQFHWREVFALIVDAIRTHASPRNAPPGIEARIEGWQYKAIADSGLFRPICYQLGHCPFIASFDRACTIRDRVQERAKHGSVDSTEWHKPFMYDNPEYKQGTDRPMYITSEGIQKEEWMLDPAAARKQ